MDVYVDTRLIAALWSQPTASRPPSIRISDFFELCSTAPAPAGGGASR
jgi:hypothetical protein